MAYNEFTLESVQAQFGLRIHESDNHFDSALPSALSQTLQRQLDKYVPLAVKLHTEKARSELIVMPVLLEVIEQFPPGAGIFSGVEFSPDPERNLRGVCDFLLTLSAQEMTINAPVITVVEAKNDSIKSGWGQCVAEMVAAQTYNSQRELPLQTIYGAVTTGTNWQFLRLSGTDIFFDGTERYISQPEKIVGILLMMLRQASAEQQVIRERQAEYRFESRVPA